MRDLGAIEDSYQKKHQQAFKQLREQLSSDETLAPYLTSLAKLEGFYGQLANTPKKTVFVYLQAGKALLV